MLRKISLQIIHIHFCCFEVLNLHQNLFLQSNILFFDFFESGQGVNDGYL